MRKQDSIIKRFIRKVFRYTLLLTVLLLIIGYFTGYGFSDYYRWYKQLRGFNTEETVKSEEFIEDEEEEPKDFHEVGYFTKDINDFEPDPRAVYDPIDAHVKNCPDSLTKTVPILAEYLSEKCSSEIEKCRAIYVWITENVKFDEERWFYHPKWRSAKDVLKHKKAASGGISNLFKALGKEMELNVQCVNGYIKDNNYFWQDEVFPGKQVWNAVKIENEWHFFDAAWGLNHGAFLMMAGFQSPEGEEEEITLKIPVSYDFFDADPYAMIFTHFPEESKFRTVSPKISFSKFKKLPDVWYGLFKAGFNGEEIYNIAFNDRDYVEPDGSGKTYAEIIKAPNRLNLSIDSTYYFEVYAPTAVNVSLQNDEQEYFLLREKGIFKGSYKPTMTGDLYLNITDHENWMNHTSVGYIVE